jgi:hypothetical protein
VDEPDTLGFVADGAAAVEVVVVFVKSYCTMTWAAAGAVSRPPTASASEAVETVRGMTHLR